MKSPKYCLDQFCFVPISRRQIQWNWYNHRDWYRMPRMCYFKWIIKVDENLYWTKFTLLRFHLHRHIRRIFYNIDEIHLCWFFHHLLRHFFEIPDKKIANPSRMFSELTSYISRISKLMRQKNFKWKFAYFTFTFFT